MILNKNTTTNRILFSFKKAKRILVLFQIFTLATGLFWGNVNGQELNTNNLGIRNSAINRAQFDNEVIIKYKKSSGRLKLSNYIKNKPMLSKIKVKKQLKNIGADVFEIGSNINMNSAIEELKKES